MAAFAPRTAAAVAYEVFIDVDTEEDLYDLLVTDQISPSSFDALLLLHQTRLELNVADREALYRLPNLKYADVDRILAFREEAGVVRSIGELVAAGVLDSRLARALEPFVVIRVPERSGRRTHGFVRAQSRWSGRHDRLPPAAAIQARLQAGTHLDAGLVGTLTRNRLRRVRWDPEREGLSVAPERVRFEVPKTYVGWRRDRWEVFAGTYRIGFGQRLTFDTTGQVTPNGALGDYELRRENDLGLRCKRGAGELPQSPCPAHRVVRVTPDFTWTNRLTGLAVGLKRVALGTGWLQAHAWGSYQIHRALRIEIYNADQCDDPRRGHDVGCAPPPVYVRGEGRSALAPTASFASLPSIVTEGLAGVHASYSWDPRSHLGVTGYASVPKWLVRGVELDFQDSARKPSGGAFGAIGIQAARGFGRQQLFVEIARSFDRQLSGGGGYGAVVRSVTSIDAGELDVSFRYYGTRYSNPYARPVSAADELDGLRARDETGLRLQAAVKPNGRIRLRALADGWRRLSSQSLHLLVFTRADFQLGRSWAWAIWAEHRSTGRRTSLAMRLAYESFRQVNLSLQLQHRWLEGPSSRARLQRDLAGVVDFSARPVDRLRVRVRLRYDLEDIVDNHRLPQTLWSYVDVAFATKAQDTLRVRYDLRAHLDERDSTRVRVPNPEHWLWLEYVFRY